MRFLSRIQAELERNTGILSEAAMAEFRAAESIYQSLIEKAED